MTLSTRARQFQETLRALRPELTVEELPSSTRTAADAAKTLGCTQSQIVKSLVFRDTERGSAVLLLVSGTNRVDERVVGQVLGGAIKKADADFVKETTGYAIGGVPPIGHKQPITTLVDADLLRYDQTWAAAGTPHAVFRITGKITDILGEHRVVRVR
ncbi:YbaK/EbsC family protein [Nocardia sp. CDC159]|uniref:YbaK/EbsC family protein n=1 Tax=Nocardia pulmonis TaxID=2951408 RepID=A0A9X2E523_9NOCA|nr:MULTISPECIES: YbaK/EbsC family protein [Nocardia]MCM6774302.1 YbaK/EbsC family protein [Nocardia pulmonis]MCM6787632.1 YbaK/EbsC family protein [Nocardia sp. CDC159]